ncbi:hypothetical protein CLV58_1033 [Spirosoma oryzae]|uniref:DUF7691 domain-containing protein n=1 Tax=Spirosoma oryzae TaxID=1469603 RepID=A0A2T0TEI1_9BACT|nr:hypothetical protein [Spirosoma oryzae]PRY44034.1 hypothetical protein CLV58_1033 [Spirosoma oryzae]
MAYGVTAYTVKWELFEKYVYGVKTTAILKSMNIYANWHVDLAELFKGTKSITPKKAAEEIVAGNITRTDRMSGGMYRYVLEKMFWKGNTLLFCKKVNPWWDACEPGESFLAIGTRLASSAFYPIKFDCVERLFFDFEEIPLPLPSQDNFPVTSFIRFEKLQELKKDFSAVNLPIECHKEFKGWLDTAIQLEHDLVLYYY